MSDCVKVQIAQVIFHGILPSHHMSCPFCSVQAGLCLNHTEYIIRSAKRPEADYFLLCATRGKGQQWEMAKDAVISAQVCLRLFLRAGTHFNYRGEG